MLISHVFIYSVLIAWRNVKLLFLLVCVYRMIKSCGVCVFIEQG